MADKHLQNSDQNTHTLEETYRVGQEPPAANRLPVTNSNTLCLCLPHRLIPRSDWTPPRRLLPPPSVPRCLACVSIQPGRLSNSSKTKRAYFCFSSTPACLGCVGMRCGGILQTDAMGGGGGGAGQRRRGRRRRRRDGSELAVAMRRAHCVTRLSVVCCYERSPSAKTGSHCIMRRASP